MFFRLQCHYHDVTVYVEWQTFETSLLSWCGRGWTHLSNVSFCRLLYLLSFKCVIQHPLLNNTPIDSFIKPCWIICNMVGTMCISLPGDSEFLLCLYTWTKPLKPSVNLDSYVSVFQLCWSGNMLCKLSSDLWFAITHCFSDADFLQLQYAEL